MKQKIAIYHLYKQNLIQKSFSTDYLNLLKNHIGFHSTDYLTPYLSLWARVEDFNPEELFNDLNKNRIALRLRAFRSTLFIVHRENIGLAIAATKKIREDRLKEGLKYLSKGFNLEASINALKDLLKSKPHLKTTEIKKELEREISPSDFNVFRNLFELNGQIIRTKQKHILDAFYCYGLLEDWLPEVVENMPDNRTAIRGILLKYLRIFGPVTLNDFAWWLPETKTKLKEIFDEIVDSLEHCTFNGLEYFFLKDELDVFQKLSESNFQEPIVNFLPYEDHFPKAYFVREHFISKEVEANLFGIGNHMAKGEIRPSIWVNGEIVGRWEYQWVDKKKSSIKVDVPYLSDSLKLSRKVTTLIELQRHSLEQFMNERMIPLIKMESDS